MLDFGFTQLLSLLAFCTVLSFTPGPNTLLASALAANFGLRATLPFVLGVPVGWLLLLMACTAGLGQIVKASALLAAAIKYGGIGYMLYLAWRLASATTLADRSAEARSKPPVSFAQGVALQFINIKAWVGATTMTSTWITSAADVPQRAALLMPIFVTFALVSNLTYAFIGSRLREWLLIGARLRVFNRTLAAALAATCVWMLFL
jgi:threonine/homoserine/homoserine lactone efflux protein